jgi:hypothetical protein
MGVTELGGQIESELHVILDDGITNLDLVGGTLLHDLLLQERLNCGVEFFADVLNQDGSTVTDASFEVLKVSTVRELEDLDLLVLSKVANPLVSLTLGIDE